MLSILGRVFLLFLLGCDWAGDPYFGRSPQSRPLASQEAYCHSLKNVQAVYDTIVHQHDTNCRGATQEERPRPPQPTAVICTPPSEIVFTESLYMFMSLQR